MNRSILVIALVLFPVSGLAGQVPGRITLDEALRVFAEHNAELALARARRDEAAALARQAGAFPNPVASLSHEPLSGDGRSYSESYLNLSQRLELPGRRGSRVRAAESALSAAVAALEADSVRLAFEVKRAWITAALADEERAVTESVAQVFRDAARHAADRYGQGDVSRYELRRIEVERTRYGVMEAGARREADSAARLLALLLDPSADARAIAPTGLPGELPPEVPGGPSTDGTPGRRPELVAAAADVDASRAAARLARAERIPELTATAGLKRQSDGLEGAFLGLSIPIPLFDRSGGRVAASEARVRMAKERLALTRRQLDNDVARAVETYASLRALEDESIDDRADGADLLAIARVAYESGEMELLELLDAAAAHRDARRAEARLRADLWIAYYDLERALGGFEPAQDSEETD